MRSQTLFVASLCLAIGLAVVPAHSQRGGVQANIPCNFAVAGKTFPAGEYMMIAASPPGQSRSCQRQNHRRGVGQ